MNKRVRIGVDVGGTFTDFVLVDEERDRIFTGKRLTTPEDPSAAILEGTERLLNEAGTEAGAVHSIVHGTTLVTNTIIERNGANPPELMKADRVVAELAEKANAYEETQGIKGFVKFVKAGKLSTIAYLLEYSDHAHENGHLPEGKKTTKNYTNNQQANFHKSFVVFKSVNMGL